MEYSPSENAKRATKALRSLQPVDSVDPDELEERLAPLGEIPTDSDSDARSMGPPGTAAPSKKRYISYCFTFLFLNLSMNHGVNIDINDSQYVDIIFDKIDNGTIINLT